MRTTVLIADDHPLVLRGLAELVSNDLDLELVASCADGDTALRLISELVPDVAIVDYNMPARTGLDILSAIRDGGIRTRMVLLTAGIADAGVYEAVAMGVEGFVLKGEAPETLTRCIREVAAGRKWLPDETVQPAIERESVRRENGDELLHALTSREREVARLAGQNLSNKEIARQLGIAEGTVKIHMVSIYSKLHVASRAALTDMLHQYLDRL
jgi:two-component system, NarL family, nitrate/nitrite response regulator NarL